MPSFPAHFDQDSFRARNDDGSESAATWKAVVNTNWNQTPDENFRIRFLIKELFGGDTGVGFKVQYNKLSGGWNDVTTSSSNVKMSASANLTEGNNTTQQIGGGTYLTNNSGQEDGDGTTPYAGSYKNKEWELEFCCQVIDADTADTDTIQLRVVDSGGMALNGYTNTPTLTVQDAAPASAGSAMMMRGVG